MCHLTSDTSTQFCQCRAKSATDSKSKERCAYVVIILFAKTGRGWIWTTGHSLPTSALGNKVCQKDMGR